MNNGIRVKLFGSVLAAAAALAFTSEARAADGEWGLHNANILSGKNLMAYGEAGWPGVSLGAQYGLSDKIDIGGRFAFLYGGFYHPSFVAPGMELNAVIRIGILKGPKYSLFAHVDPGIKFATFSGPAFGISAPFGAEFGIHFTPEATLQLGLEVPFYLNLTGGAIFVNIPPMAGPGFEYHIGDNIALGLNTRFGATIGAGGVTGGRGAGFSGAGFGFVTQAYFAYKIF